MSHPVVHFEIAGQDGKKLQEFYSSLFEWKIDSSNPYDYGMVDTGTDIGIKGGICGCEGPNRLSVYVEVDDLQAYLDKAESLGGKIVMPITEVPNVVTIAMFSDPAGNRVGLIKGR